MNATILDFVSIRNVYILIRITKHVTKCHNKKINEPCPAGNQTATVYAVDPVRIGTIGNVVGRRV